MANEEEKSKENLISDMNYLMDDGTFNINGWGSGETIQSLQCSETSKYFCLAHIWIKRSEIKKPVSIRAIGQNEKIWATSMVKTQA